MADFGPTEQEVKNVINSEENYSVIIDGTTPTYKAVVDSTGALKVFGAGGGEQYVDGTADTGAEKGNIALGSDGSNFYYLLTNNLGRLQVDVIGGGGTSGQLVTDAQAVAPGDVGRIFAGSDGSNYRHVSVDSSGQLQIDVLTLPADVDIRDLDSAQDSVAAVQSGTWTVQQGTPPWTVSATDLDIRDLSHTQDSIRIGDGTNLVDVLNDAGTYRLQVAAKIEAGGASQDVHPIDTNGVDLDVALDTARPANTRAFIFSGLDGSDIVRVPSITVDAEDGKHRVEIVGKVSTSPPEAPAATTPVTIDGSSPLSLSGTDTEDWIIPNGETFTMSQLTAGSEGDPTEKGSKVEVLYVDAASVEHLISRVYLTGFTTEIYPNTSQARDGTVMTGNGTTTLIRIYREHFGGGTRELDAVVRGYY